jgi:hypothetical protein
MTCCGKEKLDGYARRVPSTHAVSDVQLAQNGPDILVTDGVSTRTNFVHPGKTSPLNIVALGNFAYAKDGQLAKA